MGDPEDPFAPDSVRIITDPNAGGAPYGPAGYNPWAFFQQQPGMPYSPTLIPTTYDPQGYPMAVPVFPFDYSDPVGAEHAGQQLKSTHSGGLIGRKLHVGGGITRMHSGGALGGMLRGGGVHIYAFTDLRELIKHMGSREGQKIIFDTVKGRRIDLGI